MGGAACWGVVTEFGLRKAQRRLLHLGAKQLLAFRLESKLRLDPTR